MSHLNVENDYFEWMYDLVCAGRYEEPNSYRKLLTHLHNVNFTYRIRSDADRAFDGIALRHRFAVQRDVDYEYEYGYDYVMDCLDGPCSVLEMIIALAIRCEDTIMSDPQFGDRTGQWFWKMINNLGLGAMMDYRFDEIYVEKVIDNFLNRKYDPDGRGGLFMIRGCNTDMRKLSIWMQMCYFLDAIM